MSISNLACRVFFRGLCPISPEFEIRQMLHLAVSWMTVSIRIVNERVDWIAMAMMVMMRGRSYSWLQNCAWGSALVWVDAGDLGFRCWVTDFPPFRNPTTYEKKKTNTRCSRYSGDNYHGRSTHAPLWASWVGNGRWTGICCRISCTRMFRSCCCWEDAVRTVVWRNVRGVPWQPDCRRCWPRIRCWGIIRRAGAGRCWGGSRTDYLLSVDRIFAAGCSWAVPRPAIHFFRGAPRSARVCWDRKKKKTSRRKTWDWCTILSLKKVCLPRCNTKPPFMTRRFGPLALCQLLYYHPQAAFQFRNMTTSTAQTRARFPVTPSSARSLPFQWAPVRIRHSSQKFATQSSHSVDLSLGGKPKWLPLKFGYHDVLRTSPISLPTHWQTTKLCHSTSFYLENEKFSKFQPL